MTREQVTSRDQLCPSPPLARCRLRVPTSPTLCSRDPQALISALRQDKGTEPGVPGTSRAQTSLLSQTRQKR